MELIIEEVTLLKFEKIAEVKIQFKNPEMAQEKEEALALVKSEMEQLK